MASESVENYLKAIYKLQHGDQPVSTSALADRMTVSAPSATRMMQHMQSDGLVEYVSHRGVTLTGEGRDRAMRVIRRHRLIESFLVEVLGYSWDQIDDEAERLEHAVSDLFEDRIAALLGEPALCPHGDPIPDREGRITDVRYVPLSDAPPGKTLIVKRVSDNRPECLRQIDSLGLRPGTPLEVTVSQPAGVEVRIGGRHGAVPEEVARRIFVSELPGPDGQD